MRTRLLLSAALAAAALSAGCSRVQQDDVTLEDKGAPNTPLVPLVDPELQGGHVGRAPRRLTVTQLDMSIQAAVGRRWNGLDGVAASLGRADFNMVVSENTEPNLVFAKFLEDGAREVCLATAQADLGQTTAANRILARQLPDNISNLNTLSTAAVQQNLVYLSTRFWGDELAGAELEEWTTLFRTLATRAQTINRREHALAAVCIAMMTDPRFMTY